MTTPNQDFFTAAIAIIFGVVLLCRVLYLEHKTEKLLRELRSLYKEYEEMSDCHMIAIGEFIAQMEILAYSPKEINDAIRTMDLKQLVQANITLKESIKKYSKSWKI